MLWLFIAIALTCTNSVRLQKEREIGDLLDASPVSDVFQEIADLHSNSAQLPGARLRALGDLVMHIANSAKVQKTSARLALQKDKPCMKKDDHAFGALYNVQGQPVIGHVWFSDKNLVDLLEFEATKAGLTLQKVHVVMSRMDKFKDVHHDAFWFSVAAFTDKAGKPLFIMSSRGSQGVAEWVADIGLFEADVIGNLSFSTWKDVAIVKKLLNTDTVAGSLGPKIPEFLKEQMGIELLDEVKNDPSQLMSLGKWNSVTSEFAGALLEHAEIFAGALHQWSLYSPDVFGGWHWARTGNPAFLTTGISLGGAVSTMVGIHLKLQFHSTMVVGYSMNAPGVKKLLLRKLPENLQQSPLAIFQEKLKASADAGAGFVNLVAQHDIIWKIGEQVGAGQKVCMYMHPAEDFGCKTGDDKFKKWSSLSDAINIGCANGVGNAGQQSYLWWAGVELGMNVFIDLWKCTEMFSGPDGTESCWNEHQFAFGRDANPFSKPVSASQMTLKQLRNQAGTTHYTHTKPLVVEELPVLEAVLSMKEEEVDDEWNAKSPSGCHEDASASYCSVLDDNNECKYKAHGNSTAKGADTTTTRTPCALAENTRIVRSPSRSCQCATGYCFFEGKCVSGPEREKLILQVEHKKKIRAIKRKMLEGPLDMNLNYKWICSSD